MSRQTPQFAIPGLMPPVPINARASYTTTAPDGSLRMVIYQAPASSLFHNFKVVVTDISGNILFADYRRSHVHAYRSGDVLSYWLILDAGVLPVGTHQIHVWVQGFSARQPCRNIDYRVLGVVVADTPWVVAGRSRYGVSYEALLQDNALEDLVAQILRTQQASLCGSTEASAILQELYGRLDVLVDALETGSGNAQGTPTAIHFSTGGLVFQATVGNGVDVSYLITHNMLTTAVLVQAFETTVTYPNGQLVDCDAAVIDNKTVLVTFPTPPAVAAMRVMIAAGSAPAASGAPAETMLSRNVTNLVDGVRTDFSHADIDRAIAITVNGIIQSDVTFDGDTATLERAPQSGDVVLLIGADEL